MMRLLSNLRVLLALAALAARGLVEGAKGGNCAFPNGPDAMRVQLIQLLASNDASSPRQLFLDPSVRNSLKEWSSAALSAAMAWPEAQQCPAPMPGPMEQSALETACADGPWNAAYNNEYYPPSYFLKACSRGGKLGKKESTKKPKAAPAPKAKKAAGKKAAGKKKPKK